MVCALSYLPQLPTVSNVSASQRIIIFTQLAWGPYQNADFDLIQLEWGQRFRISNKFLSYADTLGTQATI